MKLTLSSRGWARAGEGLAASSGAPAPSRPSAARRETVKRCLVIWSDPPGIALASREGGTSSRRRKRQPAAGGLLPPQPERLQQHHRHAEAPGDVVDQPAPGDRAAPGRQAL